MIFLKEKKPKKFYEENENAIIAIVCGTLAVAFMLAVALLSFKSKRPAPELNPWEIFPDLTWNESAYKSIVFRPGLDSTLRNFFLI